MDYGKAALEQVANITQELLQKMGIIDSNHIFADNTARDAYFVTNPTELTEGLLISVGTGFQEFSGALWLSKTGIVQDTTLSADYITVVSKNLYNQIAVPPVDGYMYNSSGVYTASASYAVTGKIPCLANTAYAFSVNGLATIAAIAFFNGDTYLSRITSFTASNMGVIFTTPENCTHVAINLFAATHTADEFTAAVAKAQLELGSVCTQFEAYTSENLFDLTNLEQHKAFDSLKLGFIDAAGTNQYNKTLAVNGKYLNTSGVVSASASSAFTGFIPVKPNTQYCLSVDMVQLERFTGVIYEYDINGAYIKKTATVYTGVIPFYTGTTTYFVATNFLMKTHTAEEFNAVIDTIQLEYDCTRTTYEAYTAKTKINESWVSNNNYRTRLSRLEGEKAAFVGTSMTWYCSGQVYQSGSEGICQGYISHVVKNTGLCVDNYGINGVTLGPYNASSFINTYTTLLDYTKYDYLALEFGFNDRGNLIPVGTPTAAKNTTDFSGCLKTVIEYALSQNPLLKIILITEPNVESTANTNGAYLKDYMDAKKSIGSQYCLQVADGFYRCGCNSINEASLTIDGTHPNNELHKRWGYIVLEAFEAA